MEVTSELYLTTTVDDLGSLLFSVVSKRLHKLRRPPTVATVSIDYPPTCANVEARVKNAQLVGKTVFQPAGELFNVGNPISAER